MVVERDMLTGCCRTPIDRWRRPPPNPTLRRGLDAASVEREQKAEQPVTSERQQKTRANEKDTSDGVDRKTNNLLTGVAASQKSA
jgi:hypothetical protein